MFGIFPYIYHKNQPNVGKYTMTLDGMGYPILSRTFFLCFFGLDPKKKQTEAIPNTKP